MAQRRSQLVALELDMAQPAVGPAAQDSPTVDDHLLEPGIIRDAAARKLDV
jgi:hypothetical protein